MGGRGFCRAEIFGRSGDGQVGKSGKIWAHQRFAISSDLVSEHFARVFRKSRNRFWASWLKAILVVANRHFVVADSHLGRG